MSLIEVLKKVADPPAISLREDEKAQLTLEQLQRHEKESSARFTATVSSATTMACRSSKASVQRVTRPSTTFARSKTRSCEAMSRPALTTSRSLRFGRAIRNAQRLSA